MIIKCDLCKKEFNRKLSHVKRTEQKFCSRKCMYEGIIFSKKRLEKLKTNGKKGKGLKRTEQTRKKLSIAKMGDKHPLWKGDNVGYKSLHTWISRNWGRPSTCEICNTSKSIKFEWANLGIYNRNRENWKRMCCSCHRKYDNKVQNLEKYMVKKRLELLDRENNVNKMLKKGFKITKIAKILNLSVQNIYYVLK